MNEKMTAGESIRAAMAAKGWTQTALAKELGYASQSGLSDKVGKRTKTIKVSTLIQFMDAMGYDVIVKSRTGSKEQWILKESDEND